YVTNDEWSNDGLAIKQEDMIEGEEVIVGSEVDNEVIIPDQMDDSHLDAVHFEIGSSIDIDSEQMGETV
ncbi:zinc finger protein, partial [Trichonephila inaurata madagascariensis]